MSLAMIPGFSGVPSPVSSASWPCALPENRRRVFKLFFEIVEPLFRPGERCRVRLFADQSGKAIRGLGDLAGVSCAIAGEAQDRCTCGVCAIAKALDLRGERIDLGRDRTDPGIGGADPAVELVELRIGSASFALRLATLSPSAASCALAASANVAVGRLHNRRGRRRRVGTIAGAEAERCEKQQKSKIHRAQILIGKKNNHSKTNAPKQFA